MDTPSQKLSGKIVDRLVLEKLLLPNEGKKLLVKMAEGKLRPEDWRLAVENTVEKEIKK